MKIKSFSASLILLLCGLTPAIAENNSGWLSWRGPLGSGSVEGGGEYPVNFGADEYAWRAELPGKACSTPIVVGESIYVTAPVEGKDALLCFDAKGNENWRAVFGPEDPGKHRNGSGGNASPVSDGDGVFVYFKSGALAAIEANGEVRWQTNLVEKYGKDTLFWDHGTSPVLTQKHVVMARMHKGESWLAAFDKATGQLAWKVDRNYKTPMECDHGYTTPLVIEHDGKESLLVWGAEHLTIHDAADGQVVWTCGNFNPDGNQLWPQIASPVIVDDSKAGRIAVIAYGRNDRGIPRLHGIKLSGSGDVTATNHLWQRDDVGTFVPTPVAHNGKVILVRDRGEVDCLDPATGKTIWTGAFPKSRSNFYASPLVAGDKLYAPREDGLVFVASIAGEKFKLLAENDMAEPVIGSPVPLEGGVLIRGERHLFCAGSK
jgi:outer membrane protein assembly factor BamB